MEKTSTPGIYKVTTKGGETRYRVFTRVKGRQETKTLRTLQEARAWKAEKAHGKATGTAVEGSKARTRYGVYAEAWLEERRTKNGERLRPSTETRDRSYYRNHIAPRWEGVRLEDIDRRDVKRWVRDLEDAGLAAATVKKLLDLFSASLSEAVADGYLGKDPSAGVTSRQVSGNAREGRFITEAQVWEIAQARPATGDARQSLEGVEWEAFVLLLGLRGLRIGEALALHAEDLYLGGAEGTHPLADGKECSLQGPHLHVTKTLPAKGGEPTPPKTARAVRGVSLPGFLSERLTRHLAGREEGYVWRTREGGPLAASNVRKRAWKKATEAVGLPGLHPHDLRHTAASLLLAKGLPVERVSETLGHSRTSFTYDTYVKTNPTDTDAAFDALEEEEPARLRVVS